MKTNREIAGLLGVTALLLGAAGQASAARCMDTIQSVSYRMDNSTETVNTFGGPAYLGAPNLALMAALIEAGGGAENFSTARAVVDMLGVTTVGAEVGRLAEKYGVPALQNWLAGTDTLVVLSLKQLVTMGLTLPEPPADLTGPDLAAALVQAGTGPDGTFWTGRLYDTLVSHDVHDAVMGAVHGNPDLGYAYDMIAHKITNQAFYDIAQTLGCEGIKLAPLH